MTRKRNARRSSRSSRSSRKGGVVASRVKKVLDTGFLVSVGLASIAKDNVERVAGELVRKGKLNERQGRELVSDLVRRSKRERDRVRKLLGR